MPDGLTERPSLHLTSHAGNSLDGFGGGDNRDATMLREPQEIVIARHDALGFR